MADRHHLIARQKVSRRAHGGGRQVIGDFVRLQNSQIVFSLNAGDRGNGFQTIRKSHLDDFCVLHHMQIGQDDTLVNDDHAGAHAALDILLAVLVAGTFAQAHHANDGMMVA